MKIYTETQYSEDLSQYTDDELKECGVYDRDFASKPIKLKNVSLVKNSKNQLVINFETINHKYLDINYSMSSSRRVDDDGKNLWSRCIEINTQEKYPFKDEETGEKMFEAQISRLHLWLEPDTPEEEEMLNGVAAVLPLRWVYSVAIIPYSDIEVFSESSIEEFEEDMIYEEGEDFKELN